MKLYAVGLVRAILPLLQHRLAKVRIAAIDAIRDLIKVPDRGKRKGAGTGAIVELVEFRAENVLPISAFYRADVSLNYLAQVRLPGVRLLAFLFILPMWTISRKLCSADTCFDFKEACRYLYVPRARTQ